MRRRDFLRSLLTVPALATLPPGMISLARASAAPRTLVVVFQRGGCDGLNVVVPYGDPDYAGLRPTIGIPAPDGTTASAIDLNGFFGLHPALSPLAPIYSQGQLAVMPAVHFNEASRSHFDNQVYIESGTGDAAPDGWLNRYLATVYSDVPLQGASFGNQLPHAMRGDVPISTINQLGSGLGLPTGYEEKLRANLETLLNQPVSPEQINRAALHQAGLTALDVLNASADLDPDTYQPQHGAVYPESGFGQDMAQAAQLIKAGMGTEIIAIDIGGWDTHSGQGGAEGVQAGRLADFAGGLAAFHADMSDYRDDVMVLTMTEFGRTAKENASRGTDHGKAGAWFALGAVNGGIHGHWPGLSDSNLDGGRFLAHSLDFRDVMGDVLTSHLGATDLSGILPNHNYQPVGIA